MNLKRISMLVLAILMLASWALAEDYTPAAPAAQCSAEDLNGAWNIFYRVDGDAGSSTRESEFQIALAIDGESVAHTFTYPGGESSTAGTLEITAEGITLTYEDGSVADMALLEDGVLQWHVAATADTPETFMYFEKAEG